MSERARTLVAQARDALKAGKSNHAFELLQKAKLLVGTDDQLRHTILQLLTHVASQVGVSEEDAQPWRTQLAELEAAKAINSGTSVHASQPGLKRRFGSLALASSIVGTLCITAVGVFVANARMNSGSESSELYAHLQRASQSTFAIMALDGDNVIEPGLGTAWVVRNGWLATNAHVAEGIEDCKTRKLRVVARRVNEKPYEVGRVVIHPDYKRWQYTFGQRFLTKAAKPEDFVLESRRGHEVTLPTAFDVAIIQIAPNIGPPLTLASRETVENLKGGEQIGYVGFPRENIAGLGFEPEPEKVTGNLSSMADVFRNARTDRLEFTDGAKQKILVDPRLILQCQIFVSGGASGSPILNSLGEVIGLINAGHMVRLDDSQSSGRLSIGLNLGQRVDQLIDLIELENPLNESSSDDKRTQCRKRMEVLTRDIDVQLGKFMVEPSGWKNALIKIIERGDRSIRCEEVAPPKEMALKLDGGLGRASYEVPEVRPGHYYIMAIAKNYRPFDLKVKANGKDQYLVDDQWGPRVNCIGEWRPCAFDGKHYCPACYPTSPTEALENPRCPLNGDRVKGVPCLLDGKRKCNVCHSKYRIDKLAWLSWYPFEIESDRSVTLSIFAECDEASGINWGTTEFIVFLIRKS